MNDGWCSIEQFDDDGTEGGGGGEMDAGGGGVRGPWAGRAFYNGAITKKGCWDRRIGWAGVGAALPGSGTSALKIRAHPPRPPGGA
jgi:hypothetical protein